MSPADARKPPPALAKLGIPLDLPPMEARLVGALPRDDGWQFEPKWDGFRCLAFRSGPEVEIRAKSGKSLSRFFPEVVANLRAIRQSTFVLDGELLIRMDGEASFDALQMRLHPAASRIERLASETPADIVVFDCLLTRPMRPLLDKPFAERRSTLEAFLVEAGNIRGLELTPFSRELRQAQRWLKARRASLDGVMAKRLDLPYRPGERAMLKVKRVRTADCVVGGFRYQSAGRLVGSLLLGLYDANGLLHHVGFTSAINDREKPALTVRLEKLVEPIRLDSRATRRGPRAAGARSARPNGSRCGRSWSSRSAMTRSPAAASATAPASCAGVPTRGRGNAHSRRSASEREPAVPQITAGSRTGAEG
jgi:ATP-dependent DNA ligase